MQILCTECLKAVEIWQISYWFSTPWLTYLPFDKPYDRARSYFVNKNATLFQWSRFIRWRYRFSIMFIHARAYWLEGDIWPILITVHFYNAFGCGTFTQVSISPSVWMNLAMPTPFISIAFSARLLLWCWSSNAGSKWTHFCSSFACCHLDQPLYCILIRCHL